MQSIINSPVPKNQIPLEEFIQLKDSFFFAWPAKGSYILYRNLVLLWICLLPVFIFIGTGSLPLTTNITKLLHLTFIASTLVPFTILIRQILGWDYIYKILLSAIITYEESDWHDGQIWIKPDTWRSRDILIAKEEVQPIIRTIKRAIVLLIFLISLLSTAYIMMY